MAANVVGQKVSSPKMSRSPSSRSEQNKTGCVPKQIQLLLCAELTIGRYPGVGGAVLTSPTLPSMISRKHASIKFVHTASQWVIKDLNSMNGVCINHVRLPRNTYTPINHGDVITFGIDVSANDLMYVFTNTNNGCPILVLKGRSDNTHLPQTFGKRTHDTSEICTPIKKPRTNGTEGVGTTVQWPAPALPHGAGETRQTSVLKNDPATTLDKTPNGPQLKSLHVSSAESGKSDTTVVTIDSLFDPVKISPCEMLDEAIFGKSPITPRAQAVLSGVGLSVTQIQMQMAQDDFEKERNKLVSRCQAMEDELAAKNRLLLEKELNQQESVLASSEDKMFTSIEEEMTCVICHELFIKAFILPCAHSFCKLCITEWMTKKHNSECPVCRTVISAKPLHSLALDNAIGKLVARLSPVDKQARVNTVTHHEGVLRQMTATQSKGSIKATISMLSGDSSHLDTSGDSSHFNTSEDSSHFNTSGDSSHFNTSGDSSHFNTSGDSSHFNTSGDSSHFNTSGDSSHFNTSGDSFHFNTSGDSSHFNTSGDTSHLDVPGDSSHLDSSLSSTSDSSSSMDNSSSDDEGDYRGGDERCYACGRLGHCTGRCPFEIF